MFRFNDTLLMAVKADLENNTVVMLVGEPGIGKSCWTEALGRLMHTKVFTLGANECAEKSDVTGARLMPVAYDDDGNPVDFAQRFFPHAVIRDAIAYADENPNETPVLFIDEVNRTNADVTSELLSIPTRRAIGSSSLPGNLRIVCAGNDKGNINALDEASVSRMAVYRVGPDTQTFLELHAGKLHPAVEKVLSEHPDTIFGKRVVVSDVKDRDDDDTGADLFLESLLDEDDGMQQIATPRTISNVNAWLLTVSEDFLRALLQETTSVGDVDMTLLQEKIEGAVGATEFGNLLFAELVQMLTVAPSATSQTTATVVKPAAYDSLKGAADMMALENAAQAMTPRDRSGCLVYAIYERADNAPLIDVLVRHTDAFEPDDVSALVLAATSDTLSSSNVKAFLDTKSPIALGVSAILEATL